MALIKLLVLLLVSLLPWWCSAAEPVGVVTIADGDSYVVRKTQKLQLKPGFRVYAQDLLQTGPQSLATRIELTTGSIFDVGPASMGIVRPGLQGRTANKGASLYLLRGWFKVSAAPARAAGPSAVLTEPLEIGDVTGSAVLSVQADAVQVFAETGALSIMDKQLGKSAGPMALKAGGLYEARAGKKASISPRVPGAFIQSVPKSFQDSIPALAANFTSRPEPAAKSLGELSYQEAIPWLHAEPLIRNLLVTLWKNSLSNDLRQGLITHIDLHSEWRSVLFPDKDTLYKTPTAKTVSKQP